jgi:hypothetical protein
MTNTDTPRTTAPATPGAALTAEQIAAIRDNTPTDSERVARYVRSEIGRIYSHLDELCQYTMPKARHEMNDLLTENAALRDRLARAEKRERELTDVLENTHSTLYALSHICNDYRYMGDLEDHRALIRAYATRAQATRMRIHAALSTPTDGAAPPRHDEARGGSDE